MPLLSDAHYVSGLKYAELDPVHISDPEWEDLTNLLTRSVNQDYPDLSRSEAREFAERTREATLARGDFEDGGEPGYLQKHENQRIYVAHDGEVPVASLVTSDNASGHLKLGRVAAEAEINAKLHKDWGPLITSRWHWLGMRAISPSLLPERPNEVDSRDFTVVDALIFASTEKKDFKQPVSVWTWTQENWWTDTVKEAGMVAFGEPKTKWPFGPKGESPYVWEQHRRLESVELLRHNLKEKRHGRSIIADFLPHVAWVPVAA